MILSKIILLGILQGLTEFFPVSSSGHLVLLQNILGVSEPQLLIDVMVHFGTLISLVVFFRKDIIILIRTFICFVIRPKQTALDPKLRTVFGIILASVPTFLMGYFLSDFFESLFASLRAVGVALLITGFFLLLTKKAQEKKNKNFFHYLIIGVLQGTAIVPGFSRSGLTIGGALLLGWNRNEASRFSFLLSIPAIMGATLFQLTKIDLVSHSWFNIIVGVILAAVTGYLALRFVVSIVNKGKFYVFSFYCFLIGIIALLISL